MRRLTALPLFLGMLTALSHCQSSGGSDDNPSTTPDSGSDGSSSTSEAGATDSGSKSGDGGAEGGAPGDSGSTPETGTTQEAGTPEGGSTPEGGTSPEGGEAGSGEVIITGTVTSTAFTPGSHAEPTIAAGHYAGAKVCVDANDNGKCDATENPVTTDAAGYFSIILPAPAALIADIGTSAANTANGKANPTRNVFRVALEQVTEQGSNVIISPLSTEVVRLSEANGTTYEVEKENLANRLAWGATQITLDQVLADVSTLTGAVKTSLLRESNILGERFAYAITKLDRGDKYPDALAFPGGDPELTGLSGVTAATATVTDTRTTITFKQAEQAAFNVEAIPRYDHIFIIMLENKATSSILGSPYAPNINAYLSAGNQAVSYFATGNPSEPNYTALGGGDDFGLTDDSQWNCNATGANAPTDSFLPTNTAPGLASSPFISPCTTTNGTNHNMVGKPNLFNAITAAGMTWRTYSESMNPGQDFRTDSVADPAVLAQDHVYAVNTAGGNATAVGDPSLILPFPASLYKTKHHPGMAYDNVRNAPEFNYTPPRRSFAC